MTWLFWLGAATLVVYLLLGIDLLWGNRSVRSLDGVSPRLPVPAPRVSVIAAARNEARNIREALQSLLQLDYPDYELIVVDDRSEDETGAILDAMAAADPRLKAVHVRELPPRWLGKNHALWLGSQKATGELILFTDADIVMAPTTLARAVTLLRQERLDHLAVTPSMRMPSTFLQMFGTSFILYFSLFARPWKAKDPKSRYHIGIGAFNLMRAEAYRMVGGHETIRLRPDDDLKLGKILKRAGCRQDVAYGCDFMAVEWYASVGEAVRGLEKNAFSGCDYSVPFALSGALFHLVCTVWPYLALLMTSGPTRAINAAVVVLLTFLFADSARRHRAKPWHAVAFPVTTLLFVWIILRTMVLNLSRGGIVWRGTFYPLEELKSNKV